MRPLAARSRELRDLIGRLAGRALDILAPGFCRECGEPAAGADPFCPPCRARIPWIRSACPRCGLPVPNPATGGCGDCSGRSLHFDRAAAPAEYRGPWRAAVLRFKYLGDQGVRGEIAAALARTLEGLAGDSPQAIVPVPPHAWRKLLRGRDPVEELAVDLARLARIPLLRVLVRARAIPSQTSLPRARRLLNPRGAYRVRRPWPIPRRERRLPASLLVLDDVLTTCATAAECARALREAGARTVTVLAAARAEAY